MRKEMASLRARAKLDLPSDQTAARLQQLRIEAAATRERYSDEHPDAKRIEREIAALEAKQGRDGSYGESQSTRQPDNPVFIQLRTRLDATMAELASYQTQRSALQRKLESFEQRLTASPQVEREYRALMRDYEQGLAKYQEVLAKRQEAELAKNLETGQKGERFTLIEPPLVPEEPDQPNRMAIALLGVVLATAGSVGSGAMAESMDQRIYGRRGVSALAGVPPLAVIPRFGDAEAAQKRRRRWIMIGAALALCVIAGAMATHLLISPLDVLVFRTIRVLGI
jgi:uncharacterized protein involved in exopolysaccharide biosynthesis